MSEERGTGRATKVAVEVRSGWSEVVFPYSFQPFKRSAFRQVRHSSFRHRLLCFGDQLVYFVVENLLAGRADVLLTDDSLDVNEE